MIPVPKDLGVVYFSTEQGESFCYIDVHTHDFSGTLHLAIDPKNPRLFEPVLRALADKLNRPLSSVSAIYTNGQETSPLYVEPDMHIKVVFGQ